MQTRIEINPATSQWRFYDCELEVYSSKEWPKKIDAIKESNKYMKKHRLRYTKRRK